MSEALPTKLYYQSVRLRRFAFRAACVFELLGVVVLGYPTFMHDRQGVGLDAFLRGPDFAAYTADMNRRFVATFSFASARPQTMDALLPVVAAGHEVP